MSSKGSHTTYKGRVVYDRKPHDFIWADCYRIMNHGLGIPEYRSDYVLTMAGLPRGDLNESPEAAGEYIAFILCFDLINTFLSYAPRGFLDSGELITAYSRLKPIQKAKYSNVLQINLRKLFEGLISLFESLFGGI